MADERDPEQQRLLGELLEPAVVAQARGAEPQIGVPARLAIDERLHAELLRETPELAGRGRAFLQVHEVGLDAPFGEEAEGLSRLAALPDAENLDFHGAGI